MPIQGQVYASVALSPGELHRLDLEVGEAKIRSGEHVFEGPIVSRHRINPLHTAEDFFNSRTNSFYYVIKSGRITAVKVRDAGPLEKQWKDLERGFGGIGK